MNRVFIAGVGMTPFVSRTDRSIGSLAGAAAAEALRDAGIEVSELGRLYFGNGAAGLLTGQEMIRGQVALRRTPLAGIPLVNVENACASGSSAILGAFDAISAGRCDVALAVGVEKLSSEDKHRTFAAIRGATDVSDIDEDDASRELKSSALLDVYAEEAQTYMVEYGASVEDFAAVAVKNRTHGALNPRAQFTAPQTVEDVLAARMIVDPLTLPMCSPTTDGAAAVLLVSERYRARAGISGCEIRGIDVASGTGAGSAPVARAARAVYDASGIGPEDLNVVEVHDAAAPSEILQYGEIGLCAEGEGHLLLRKGQTSLGGRVPVNTSGGLLSRGHPLGATGCAQIVELFDQLTGRAGSRQVEGARTALAVNAGGWLAGAYATTVATVLTR
ncbi:thiolase family protein [Nocardia sp. NPDC004123]